MAETGPQAPPIPEAALEPQVPQEPKAPQQPAWHIPQLNWSHFRPKFSGKLEEDAEAHLLRTNDWMNTHRFQEDNKGQRFCLTQTGEARLSYESLRHSDSNTQR